MKKLSVIVLLLLVSVSAVWALDDRGNPNDPRVNERANACYEDGSLAGRCHTEWDWVAGWYLIRFQFGLISRANFPAEYVSVLPPEVVTTGGSPLPPAGPLNGPAPAGCYYNPGLNLYGIWNGGASQSGITYSWDSGCTSQHTGVGGLHVSAPDAVSAGTACIAGGANTPVAERMPSSQTNAWPIYQCST
ncbi:MAG: hypothetical protein U0694_03230 [Anaerolineae bacterium]